MDNLTEDFQIIQILLFFISIYFVSLNARAFELTCENAKLLANKNGDGSELYVNFIDRYPTILELKQTNGVLQEIPNMLPAINVNNPTQAAELPDEFDSYIKTFMPVARSRGVTMSYDAGMSDSMCMLLKSNLVDQPEAMRIEMAQQIASIGYLDSLGDLQTSTKNARNIDGSIDLYHGGVKIISNGSNQNFTGY